MAILGVSRKKDSYCNARAYLLVIKNAFEFRTAELVGQKSTAQPVGFYGMHAFPH
jgi:hypothetical protein